MNCLLDKAPFGTFCDQKGKLFYENQDFSTFEARSKPKFNFLKFSKLRLSSTVINLEIVSFSTVPLDFSFRLENLSLFHLPYFA